MKPKFYLLILFAFSCPYWMVAQSQESIIPLSVTENLPLITKFEVMPLEELENCLDETVSHPEFTKFACPLYANLRPDNSGEWTETPNGRIWRLAIRSPNAHSLYISLHFSLHPEARLFIYDPKFDYLRGAYTALNNNSVEILTVAPVQGEELIVELNLPPTQSIYGKLQVTKVYHDFYNVFKERLSSARKLPNGNKCEEDINCINGQFWQTEKRAVCKIITNGGIGTGTLIGNTSGSDAPYVLTAQHLISSAEMAAEALFVFNYESAGCGEGLASNSKSISGAALLATTDQQIDFTLLRLFEKLPPAYRPYYAGWDSRNINPQSGVSIHHAFGGPQQIAIEYHPIESEDIGRGYEENSTWKVSHWEVGTTESGSSGAPLFNEQHRIVGTLTGGRSTCGYAKDDYFTKFSAAWDHYPEPSRQLKYWLDPDQTGEKVLDGYDPYGFNVEHCDTAWNFVARDKKEINGTGLAWGWASGHNAERYTQYAERYESSGALHINGAYLDVAKAYASHSLSYIEVKVWEGDLYPERESYSKLVFIKDLQPNKINYIAFDSVLKKSGPVFIGYKINYESAVDSFAVYHAVNRGQQGASSMYRYNEQGWHSSNSDKQYGMSTSLGVGLSVCYGKFHPLTPNEIKLYPNPSTNLIFLEIPKNAAIQHVQCFDNQGQLVNGALKQSEEHNALHFNLPSGIYYLKVITLERIYTARFIVL